MASRLMLPSGPTVLPNSGEGLDPAASVADLKRAIVSRDPASDMIFRRTAFGAGIITVGIMLAVGLFLSLRASDALRTAGWSFLYVQNWAPERLDFGVAAILFGTVTIALIALTVSFPLSLGTALLLSEAVDGKLRGFLVSLVDLMAAVPSIVFGLWGVYFLQGAIIPVSRWISIWFGWLPIFAVTDAAGLPFSEASAFTSSAFIAGIVVGFMVVPTQTSIMREAFTRAPMGSVKAPTPSAPPAGA